MNSVLRKIFEKNYPYLIGLHRNIIGQDNTITIQAKRPLPVLKNLILKIQGNGNCIIINSGVNLCDSKIEIHGDNNLLFIDDYCKIRGSYLWIEDYECQLRIGKCTTIEKEVKICVTEPSSKITIGKDCMFAYGVVIRSGDSHSIIDLDSNERINYAADIQIDNHVWIGTNAQILKGVVIGSESIVAAGAIVTKDVPPHCIVAGIPAEVKKTKVRWIRQKI